jgi:enhancing lycopene biosynthesis protein 2
MGVAMTKKFAVILSGCGNKDGAEIHESVSTLLAIKKAGHDYQCFAPDIEQHRVVNHYTGEVTGEKRRVLVESARIARGKIKPLNEFQEKDFDILMIPGGLGAALNLSSFGVKGTECEVNGDVARAVQSMHQAGKPTGALCIAPVILGKILSGVLVTVGNDKDVNRALATMGARTQDVPSDEIVVDAANRVVTGPCYMYDADILQVATCAERVVGKVLEMATAQQPIRR